MRDLLGVLRSMEILQERRQQFYQTIQEKQKGTLPGSFAVENGDLVADVLGNKLRARPRVVRMPDGSVALEFLFRAEPLEDAEVWRFYLKGDGTLSATAFDADNEVRFSDVGNDYAWKHLLERLLLATLDSSLFSPTPPTTKALPAPHIGFHQTRLSS